MRRAVRNFKELETRLDFAWSLRRSFQGGSRNRAVKGRGGRAACASFLEAFPLDRALVGCLPLSSVSGATTP